MVLRYKGLVENQEIYVVGPRGHGSILELS